MTAPSADHCGQWKISGCDNAQPHGPAEPETGLFHHWALTPCALMQCAPASDAFFPQAFDCRASCSCRYALATSRCSHPLAACTRWLLAPARCSHLLFALPHSLRSPTRCSPPLAALPHSLLSPPTRCSSQLAALHRTLLSPARFSPPLPARHGPHHAPFRLPWFYSLGFQPQGCQPSAPSCCSRPFGALNLSSPTIRSSLCRLPAGLGAENLVCGVFSVLGRHAGAFGGRRCRRPCQQAA